MLTDAAAIALAVTLTSEPPTSAGVVDIGPVITRHDSARADGTPVWSSSASYELSTGNIAEVYVEIDGTGSGEIEIAIDGDTIVHSWSDGSGVETWTPTAPTTRRRSSKRR